MDRRHMFMCVNVNINSSSASTYLDSTLLPTAGSTNLWPNGETELEKVERQISQEESDECETTSDCWEPPVGQSDLGLIDSVNRSLKD